MDRPVYAFEFAVQRSGPEAIEAVIDKYGIDTVVLSPIRRKDRELIPYFDKRYAAPTDSIARVYRVRTARD